MSKPVLFHNWSDEDFIHAWDSVDFTFEKGTKVYLEPWKAEHFAKHFVDREMMRENISIDDQSREEFIKKTLGIVEDAKEMEDTALETEILNMNAPKNKGGRPKKEVKEEKFEGMEEPVEPVEPVK